MVDVFQKEINVPQVHISMVKDVLEKEVVLMVRYGIKHYLNVYAQVIHFGMVKNVLDVQVVRYIKVQVVSVLMDCFGMDKNVQLLIQELVEVWKIVFGIKVDVIVDQVSIRKVELVFVMDFLIIISVIGVI